MPDTLTGADTVPVPEPTMGPIVIPIPDTVRARYEMLGYTERELTSMLRPVVFQPNVSLNEIRRFQDVLSGTYAFEFLPFEVAKTLTARLTNGRAELVVDDAELRAIVLPVRETDRVVLVNEGPSTMLYFSEEEYASLGDRQAIYIRALIGAIGTINNYYSDARYRRELITARLRRTGRLRRYGVEETVNVRSGGGDFTKFLRKFHRELKVSSHPFSDIAILPHKTASSRRWGIEVEAVDIGGISTPSGWDLKSDGSLRSLGYLDDHDDECEVYAVDDEGNSLDWGCNCGYEYGDNETTTGEYTSPILRSFHSRGLEYLCRELEERDTNTTPGVHVHVSADDLSPRQAGLVSLLYTAFEPLFESEYKREEREYCASLDSEEVLARLRSLREAQRDNPKAKAVDLDNYRHQRYVTVNLCALTSHGTIEFRAMGPRYNYEHLIRWAYFCRELVNLAKSNVKQKEWSKVRSFRDVLYLFSKYGKETPTPEWVASNPVLSEDLGLASENRRVPNHSVFITSQGVTTDDVFDDYVGNVAFARGYQHAR